MLYLHGVSNTRAYSHRVGLYKVLLGLGYRVLAIDYRGFGDSDKVDTTEDTVVEDAMAAMEWMRNKIEDHEKIVVWGHSLGAAIACRATAEEEKNNSLNHRIETLVLESPFNNLHDEIQDVVFKSRGKIPSVVGAMLPVSKQLQAASIEFSSDIWIRAIRTDTVILHAQDDQTIDIRLGKNLYEAAREHGKKNIEIVIFEAALKLGHNYIFTNEQFPFIIQKYIEKN